jgi:uncharacterized protein (TIGR02117 family)
MRKFIKAFGFVIGAGLLALIAGTLVPRPLFSANDSEEKLVEILVTTNPIHTDIAIPVTKETLQTFGFLSESGLPMDAPGLHWLVFGWGGRAFYMETPSWSQVKLVPVLKALTLDDSALHVELVGEINRAIPNVRPVRLSIHNAEQIYSQIAASFAGSEPRSIGDTGYGANDRFYAAKGYFNVLLGCNTWAARMLRSAGARTGIWNPLPQSLGLSLDLHN